MDQTVSQETTSQERDQAARIFAGVPVGVFVLDREWRFLSLNPCAERFFKRVVRYGRDELLGRIIWESCPEVADSTFAREYQKATAEGRRFHLEVCYPPDNRWFTLEAEPSDDCRCFFLQDVSDRVELERAVRRSMEELDRPRSR
jgi:PAS domain-containing protein